MGAIAVINLGGLAAFGNMFGEEIWENLEAQDLQFLKCYRQSLLDSSGGRLEGGNTERRPNCLAREVSVHS